MPRNPEHRPLRFERRHERLAPFSIFAQRMAVSLAIGLGLVAVALAIGIGGYYWLARFSLIDSLLEASMILGGMGPVHADKLSTDTAKVFASLYALFSGLMFIGIVGVVFSPIIHRFVHRFHIDEEDEPVSEA